MTFVPEAIMAGAPTILPGQSITLTSNTPEGPAYLFKLTRSGMDFVEIPRLQLDGFGHEVDAATGEVSGQTDEPPPPPPPPSPSKFPGVVLAAIAAVIALALSKRK